MKRFGIFGEGQAKKRLYVLQARFPKVALDLQILPIDKHYPDLLKKKGGDRFNSMSLSVCGLCKLESRMVGIGEGEEG